MKRFGIFTALLLLAALIAVPANAQHSAIASHINSRSQEIMTHLNDVMSELHVTLKDVQDRRLWGDYSTEKIEMEFAGRTGMSVTIDHRFGDITVVKGADDKVKIRGEKRVSADDKELEKAFIKEMKLNVEETSAGLRITAEYPEERTRERKYRKEIKNFAIMYTLEVPASLDLTMENSFGNIDLSEIGGTLDVRNGFGTLNGKELNGTVELRNQFGALDAEQVTGEARIMNEHGELTIRTVKGSLEAGNQFGEIRIDDVTGDLAVEGGHGQMTVKRIGGDADLRNSFAKIDCSDIGGLLEIQNNNSSVEVYNAEKDVIIDNSFGRVRVTDVKGSVEIDNNNSAVSVDDIGGSVDITNSFGSVEIAGVNGDIEVINRNGGIDARDILLSGEESRRVILETSFANIEISLPANISASIDASTTFGNIRSDFEPVRERSSINSRRMSFELGDALHEIELESKNGSIAIRKR